MLKSERWRKPEQPDPTNASSQLLEALISHVTAMHGFIRAVADDLGCAARSDVPALITARSALERETLARLIHRASERREGPFMPIHCDVQRVANLERLLEASRGGTVFFDHIGAMKRPMQNRLHSLLDRGVGVALQEGTCHDVRIVSGTSYSLSTQVAAGAFNEDLFYRLNVIHLMAVDHRPHVATRGVHRRSHRAGGPNVFPRVLDE